jgi:hypothetical protein
MRCMRLYPIIKQTKLVVTYLLRINRSRKSARSSLLLMNDLGFEVNTTCIKDETIAPMLAIPIKAAVELLEPRDAAKI